MKFSKTDLKIWQLLLKKKKTSKIYGLGEGSIGREPQVLQTLDGTNKSTKQSLPV